MAPSTKIITPYTAINLTTKQFFVCLCFVQLKRSQYMISQREVENQQKPWPCKYNFQPSAKPTFPFAGLQLIGSVQNCAYTFGQNECNSKKYLTTNIRVS
jgi:hypothetical protein